MSNKADRIELKDLEIYILNRLEDLIWGFDDNFADKMTTKWSFETLENKILALLELLNAFKNNKNLKIEDVMLSKWPLTGNSCASCDKHSILLSGMPAEYTVKSGMPLRDVSK